MSEHLPRDAPTAEIVDPVENPALSGANDMRSGQPETESGSTSPRRRGYEAIALGADWPSFPMESLPSLSSTQR
jgi:hypothetical protein